MAIAAVQRFDRQIEIQLGVLQLPFNSRVIQCAFLLSFRKQIQ